MSKVHAYYISSFSLSSWGGQKAWGQAGEVLHTLTVAWEMVRIPFFTAHFLLCHTFRILGSKSNRTRYDIMIHCGMCNHLAGGKTAIMKSCPQIKPASFLKPHKAANPGCLLYQVERNSDRQACTEMLTVEQFLTVKMEKRRESSSRRNIFIIVTTQSFPLCEGGQSSTTG